MILWDRFVRDYLSPPLLLIFSFYSKTFFHPIQLSFPFTSLQANFLSSVRLAISTWVPPFFFPSLNLGSPFSVVIPLAEGLVSSTICVTISSFCGLTPQEGSDKLISLPKHPLEFSFLVPSYASFRTTPGCETVNLCSACYVFYCVLL